MKVLKAIGGFFARIGKWIRDTAWVQPLLIVGGIFALIFAIKPTVNWVKSWFSTGDAVEKYYQNKKLSWDNAGNGNSQVEHLFDYMMDPEGKYKGEFAEKFFVLFYVDGSEGCTANYDGFNFLEQNIGKDEFSNEQLKLDLDKRDYANSDALFNSAYEASKTLTIYTVDCGEIDDRDSSESKHKTYFEKYIYGSKTGTAELPGQDLFGYLVEEEEYTTPYLNSIASEQGGDGNKLLAKKWAFQEDTTETTGFYQPSCLLYEKSYYGQALEYNISEVMFDFQGEEGTGTASDKGRTVWNCWTHNKNFSRYDDRK